jgi:phage terminase small subunit
MSRPRAPEGLDQAGKRLWRSVQAAYELSPAEAETLRQACRVADVLARIDAALSAGEVTVTGSMGQDRPNPLLAASADQRRTLDGLLRSLSLPMPGEAEGHRRSPAAVANAQARWRAQRG